MATTELPIIARAMSLDLILVQEQYAYGGLPILQVDGSAIAGIYIANPRLGVASIEHLSTSHCMVVSASTGPEAEVVFVALYCQYADDIDLHLDAIDRPLDRAYGCRTVVGGDMNAHSPIWHSAPKHSTGRGRRAEHRRNCVENIILYRNLVLWNEAGQPSTFFGPNGDSTIDLTLSTRSVGISNCRVHTRASSSDHRLITFVVGGSGTSVRVDFDPPKGAKLPRFRVSGVDWEGFRRVISARIGYLNVHEPPSELARNLRKNGLRLLGDQK